jgi:pimeloyl-ACP methyl ester carboxylesterase
VSSPHRLFRLSGLAIVLIGAACLVAACSGDDGSGTTGSTAQVDPDADFEGTVEIEGDRKIYMECRGSGSPTVILVSGLDAGADLWNCPDQDGPTVFPEVANSTRVRVYERPGAPQAVGGESRSDPVAQPTSTEDSVSDLRKLLAAAGIPGPYVLVGRSYGGLVTRLYASTYPDEVFGMVLVDSFSPEIREEMTPKSGRSEKRPMRAGRRTLPTIRHWSGSTTTSPWTRSRQAGGSSRCRWSC